MKVITIHIRIVMTVTNNKLKVIGGSEQIRTAVEAFAELCLTARPRNLLRWAKVVYSD